MIMATTELNIEVKASPIITKVRRNLAIIGKRARRNDGESMYSDITASDAETPIFYDLLMFGAENIVSELSEMASGYVEQDDVVTTGSGADAVTTEPYIKFDLYSDRWSFGADADPDMDVTKALEGMISNYLYNFCLARYLSEIHPSTGDKYPPLFGRTYTDHCELLMRNIKSLAFLKRNAVAPEGDDNETMSYGALSDNNETETE